MSIKELPSMEHTFTVSIKGSETGQMFDGTFTYKRPDIGTKSEIGKFTTFLNGDLKNLDEDTKFLHGILATLKHTLTKAPQWWEDADSGYKLYDINVIFDIYSECRKFENKWFSKVWGEPEKEESKPKPVKKAKAVG